jgi:hypothetical protein
VCRAECETGHGDVLRLVDFAFQDLGDLAVEVCDDRGRGSMQSHTVAVVLEIGRAKAREVVQRCLSLICLYTAIPTIIALLVFKVLTGRRSEDEGSSVLS